MEELYTRIEDYLDQVMSPEERLRFEADLTADPALTLAFEEVRDLRARLGHTWAHEGADRDLNDTLQSLGRQHFPAASPGLFFFKNRRLWAAAAVLVLALSAILFWPKGARHERQYARLRQFPEAAFATRASGAGPDTLSLAGDRFNRKDYTGAATLFSAYLQDHPGDSEALLFNALCQLESGQSDAATRTLAQLSESRNAWSDEASWYLALAYLRAGDKENSLRALQAVRPDGRHGAEAKALQQWWH